MCDLQSCNQKWAQGETVKKLKRKQYYLQQKNNELMKQMSANNLSFFVNKILKGDHFKKESSPNSSCLVKMVKTPPVIFFSRRKCTRCSQPGICARQRIMRTKGA